MRRLLLVVLMILVLTGCKPKSPPEFHRGQVVKIVVDGTRGQVVGEQCANGQWYYVVRIVSNKQPGIWSSGRKYEKVSFKGFELDLWEEGQ